jgi:hypothetical protein
MRMTRRGLYAGLVAVLVAAGCQGLSGNLLQIFSSDGEQVFAGSLDVVAQSTKASLQRFGCSVLETNEGGALRLSCVTRSQQHFDLVLTAENQPSGQVTHVRVEWKDGKDKDTVNQVLAQVSVQSGPAPGGAQK